jgi:hypothetical protein
VYEAAQKAFTKAKLTAATGTPKLVVGPLREELATP